MDCHLGRQHRCFAGLRLLWHNHVYNRWAKLSKVENKKTLKCLSHASFKCCLIILPIVKFDFYFCLSLTRLGADMLRTDNFPPRLFHEGQHWTDRGVEDGSETAERGHGHAREV